jgi:hypothetical protein
MTMLRSTLRPFSFALALLAAGAPALMAQNRSLFTWSGRVDREIQITMRGRDVWTNGVDNQDGARSRVSVASALPRTDGYVRVQAENGRGDVSVVQQPASWNNYTTIVRVRDRSSGADRYRVAAYWESRYSDNRGNGGDDRRNGGYGRDDGGYGRDDGGYGRDDGGHGRDDGGYGRGSHYPRQIDTRDRGNGGWGNGNNGSGSAFRWSGSVDNELEIRLAGRRFDERTLSGAGTRNERSAVIDGLPRRDVQLMIAQRQGRGTVYVAQQPNASNGYVAVIRVKDPQPGFGYYDFGVDYR